MNYKSKNEKLIKTFKVNDNLSPDIFIEKKGDYIMKDNVRKHLLKIADDFLESIGVDLFIHDVILTGSLANYNWSKYSDVDLHIIIDFTELDNIEIMKEFFNTKKALWNNNNEIKIHEHDVEVYIQDLSEKHTSTGIYSILNNKWVEVPEKTKENIDKNKILQKTEYFMKLIDKDNISLKQIENIKNKIKKFRKGGLEKNGEYSYENLVFKMLRRNGYLKKINDIMQNIKNQNFSI